VFGEPQIDRLDGIVEDRLGGVAGDQHDLPVLGLGDRRRRYRQDNDKNSGTKPDDEGSGHIGVFHDSAIDSQVVQRREHGLQRAINVALFRLSRPIALA
jgi:hypothetical protein